MAGAVASNNQRSAEGQHGHGATQRQQISGVVHFEADGLFECRKNQAHNNHIAHIVVQAGCSPRECLRTAPAALQTWVEVQFAHPLAV